MGAVEILMQLAAEGLHVEREGLANLRVTPAAAITAAHRSVILEHKSALLDLLADAHATTSRLLSAIDEACALRGDDDANRLALRAECAELGPAEQVDLAEHFEQIAAAWRKATGTPDPTERNP